MTRDGGVPRGISRRRLLGAGVGAGAAAVAGYGSLRWWRRRHRGPSVREVQGSPGQQLIATDMLPLPQIGAEAKAIAEAYARAGDRITPGMAYVLDRGIRRLQAGGVWDRLQQLCIVGSSEGQYRVNLRDPGRQDLIRVGQPGYRNPSVFDGTAAAPGSGATFPGAGDYYDTGIALSAIDPADHAVGVYVTHNSAPSGAADFGAVDGDAGIVLRVLNASASPLTFTGRMMSTVPDGDVFGRAEDWDPAGLHGYTTAPGPGGRILFHNSVPVSLLAVNPVPSRSAQTLRVGQAAGMMGESSIRAHLGHFVARGLSERQYDLLYQVMRTWIESVQHGAVVISEPGAAPADIEADVIVFGWTAQGVCAAHEAARNGRRVALVGGWNDYSPTHLGGVSANGLGELDIIAPQAIGGIFRRIVDDARLSDNVADETLRFVPRTFNWRCRNLLDYARSQGASRIGIYATGGWPRVTRRGDRIVDIVTADGRRFRAPYYIDCSYAGDLMAAAGISHVTGREARGERLEALNGYLATRTMSGGKGDMGVNAAQPGLETRDLTFDIDPYVRPGHPGSGLIAGVTHAPPLREGAADGLTQAYNYRVTLQVGHSRQRPIRKPAGYDPARMELLGRILATAEADGGAPASLWDVLKPSLLYKNIVDCNSKGGFSTDLVGSGTAFVAATDQAARLRVARDVRVHVQSVLYYLAADPDPRIPETVREGMATLGYSVDHYLDPGPNDEAYFPGTLYEREARRMRSALIWTANDMAAGDGAIPRSIRTLSVASYPFDSHTIQRFVDGRGGKARIWSEGSFFVEQSCGPNHVAPLPREIFLPRREECTNLGVAFAISATHVAFGAIRMEATSSLAAQGLAMLAVIAGEAGNIALHDVDDGEFRRRMARTPERIPPHLPQRS